MKIFWKIARESAKALILASLISSLGGIGLENVSVKLVTLLPILILIPAMNDMIGDFGAVISSKLTTMLYMGKVKEKRWWHSHDIGNLFVTVAIVAVLSGIYISVVSSIIAALNGFDMTLFFLIKLVITTVMTTSIMIVFMFWLSATAGFYVFKKNEDPANFLIPLTTSVADLGSMFIITLIVMFFF